MKLLALTGALLCAVTTGSVFAQTLGPRVENNVPEFFGRTAELAPVSNAGRGSAALPPTGQRYFGTNVNGCVNLPLPTGPSSGFYQPPYIDVITVNIGVLPSNAYISASGAAVGNMRRDVAFPNNDTRGAIEGRVDLEVFNGSTWNVVGAFAGTQRAYWRVTMAVDNLTYTAGLQLDSLVDAAALAGQEARVVWRSRLPAFGSAANYTRYSTLNTFNAVCGANLMVSVDTPVNNNRK